MSSITFLEWGQYARRAALLGALFGGQVHAFHVGKRGRPLQLPLRYGVQAWRTWRVLCQEKPDVIWVQNPPIVLALVAHAYARLHRARLVIDSHTGAFVSSPWRQLLWLHRYLSRRAAVTIVHNRMQAEVVATWQCRYAVVGYTPGTYPIGEPYPLENGLNVAVVNTFADDEPLEAVLAAATNVPEANFYVTGDPARAAQGRLEGCPGNCHLTGYLMNEQYFGLLRSADVILDLTTRSNSLLMGGFEAVTLGVPLITSDCPLLREYFPLGTVHVANTAEGIAEGVRRAQRELPDLRRGIVALCEQLQREWEQKRAELTALLSAPVDD